MGAANIFSSSNSHLESAGAPRIEWAPIATIRPNPKNARTHSRKQIRQIAASIRKLGFLNPLIVDEANMILAGHGRLEAARLEGLTHVPIIRFKRLAPKFGVPAQDDEGLNTLARFWHELPAWPDVVGGLYRLKPRYMIAPLSNGHVALLVSMSKSLGLPWDMIFGADLFRHYKPDPETYLGAAASIKASPTRSAPSGRPTGGSSPTASRSAGTRSERRAGARLSPAPFPTPSYLRRACYSVRGDFAN